MIDDASVEYARIEGFFFVSFQDSLSTHTWISARFFFFYVACFLMGFLACLMGRMFRFSFLFYTYRFGAPGKRLFVLGSGVRKLRWEFTFLLFSWVQIYWFCAGTCWYGTFAFFFLLRSELGEFKLVCIWLHGSSTGFRLQWMNLCFFSFSESVLTTAASWWGYRLWTRNAGFLYGYHTVLVK